MNSKDHRHLWNKYKNLVSIAKEAEMFKTRLFNLNLVIGAVLILAVLVAFRISPLSSAAKPSSAANLGMGDLHQVEAQPCILNWELKSSPRYTGRGDWRQFEVQPEIRTSGTLESSRANIGMGDLHRAEMPAASSTIGALYARSIGTLASGRAGVGMGDLHRLEIQHSLSLQHSQAAEAARWIAMGKYYQSKQAQALKRSQAADAARWKAMGEYYLAKQAQALQRSWEAEAARLTGLGEYYLSKLANAK